VDRCARLKEKLAARCAKLAQWLDLSESERRSKFLPQQFRRSTVLENKVVDEPDTRQLPPASLLGPPGDFLTTPVQPGALDSLLSTASTKFANVWRVGVCGPL
jgi:hypothetical protein